MILSFIASLSGQQRSVFGPMLRVACTATTLLEIAQQAATLLLLAGLGFQSSMTFNGELTAYHDDTNRLSKPPLVT